jgi:hypothetical protein
MAPSSNIKPTEMSMIIGASPYLQTPKPTHYRICKSKHNINHLWELKTKI